MHVQKKRTFADNVRSVTPAVIKTDLVPDLDPARGSAARKDAQRGFVTSRPRQHDQEFARSRNFAWRRKAVA